MSLALPLGATRAKADTSAIEQSRLREYGTPLGEFDYADVHFMPGLQLTQLEETYSVLQGLSEDSLLKPFRKRLGLSAPGCDLPGWYGSEGSAGETFGQWLSGMARYSRITGSEEARSKVKRLIAYFSETIEPTGKLYGRIEDTGGAAYLYDKIICGLSDGAQFADDDRALQIAAEATEAVHDHLPGRAVDNDTRESYTLPENQFIAWQRGGDVAHFTLAKQYLHPAYFDPLSQGVNVLAGRHAYSHTNALCSAAKAYLVLGQPEYLSAAKNGFQFIAEQSYATGGWGPNEMFLPAPERERFGMEPINGLRESLTKTHWSFESCCGSYAHFKLTRYLLRITKESEYGDSMERVMYNAILGAKALQRDGRAFYYSDYNTDGRKTYFDGLGGQITAEWPCCSGTLPQAVADYWISTYFRDRDGVYVNLYIQSTLNWKLNGVPVELSQSGGYPLGDDVTLRIASKRPETWTMHLRIPKWARAAHVFVNGNRVPTPAIPGTFMAVRRVWRTGDRVDMQFDRQMQLAPIDGESPDSVAVVFGPLVLFAEAPPPSPLRRSQLLGSRRATADGMEWHVDAEGGPIALKPFWKLGNRSYRTYLDVSG